MWEVTSGASTGFGKHWTQSPRRIVRPLDQDTPFHFLCVLSRVVFRPNQPPLLLGPSRLKMPKANWAVRVLTAPLSRTRTSLKCSRKTVVSQGFFTYSFIFVSTASFSSAPTAVRGCRSAHWSRVCRPSLPNLLSDQTGQFIRALNRKLSYDDVVNRAKKRSILLDPSALSLRTQA